MSDRGRIYLSFDVEEFDLPNEYGADLPLSDQLAIGRRGFEEALALLDRLGITATLFTTSRFGEHAADLLRPASGSHEIASHGVRHDRVEEADLAESRRRLESITGSDVTGFRMPRLQPVRVEALAEAGYRYDSSENPVRLPGRYDNRHLPRTPRREGDLLRVPVSATPGMRIPLFWLAFRHLPGPMLRRCLDRTLAHDGRLVLFFHPWELLPPDRSHPMPAVVRRGAGARLRRRLERELGRLRDRGTFAGMSELTTMVG